MGVWMTFKGRLRRVGDGCTEWTREGGHLWPPTVHVHPVCGVRALSGTGHRPVPVVYPVESGRTALVYPGRVHLEGSPRTPIARRLVKVGLFGQL